MMQKIEYFIKYNFAQNLYSQRLGLIRSILALGTLLTLLFNPSDNFLYLVDYGVPMNDIILEDNVYNNLNLFLLFGLEYFSVMKIIAIFFLILVVIGVYPRYTAILHWWTTWSFMLVTSAIDGGDQIAAILSFLLIPICIFDSRTNHWKDSEKSENSLKFMFANIVLIIIRLQAAGIYFHAAIGKFNNIEWANGTALYYWFNHPVFGMQNYLKFIFDPILENSFLTTTLTYSVLFFELLLFSSFFMEQKYRKYLFIPAILFHGGIVLVHGIFSFFFLWWYY